MVHIRNIRITDCHYNELQFTYLSHLVYEDVYVQQKRPPGAFAFVRPINVGGQWSITDVVEVASS